MSKLKFVLPIATALGVVLLLSCSSIEDAIQESKCNSNQGEWDATAKVCVKCPEGTTKQADGQCVAAAVGSVCPPRTRPNANGVCVADVVAVDPTVAAGTYYCDYGVVDSLIEVGEGGCFEIEYESQCDRDWGRLVPSCQTRDRRTDALTYCDFGPVDEYGGGCYLVLNASDCDQDWGIVANRCGTQIKWPGGTVCPTGAGKTVLADIGYACARDSGITDGTARYCDYGYKHSTAPQVDDGGGCFEVAKASDCEGEYGQLVNSCNPSDRRTDLDYCDYGRWNEYGGGCYAIRTSAERSSCNTQYATIVKKCLWLNP